MPLYTYQAVDKKGKRLNGQMPAQSEASLEEKLKANDVWLLEAKIQRGPAAAAARAAQPDTKWKGAALKRRDLIDLCTLMAFQAKVGVPLMQALDVAAHDCESQTLKRILAGMQRHIESGLLFYEALEKYPKAFSPHFVSVIRAGEMSSRLPDAFTDMHNYLEWVDRVQADVKQASLYPGIVLSVVSLFVIGLFTFIIPKFALLLRSVNAELPLLTRIVFAISDFFQGSWYIWLLIIPFIVISILVAKRLSPRVAYWYDTVKLKLPIVGQLNWMLAISRFTHNLAILYRSGIPIVQAFDLCKGLIGNMVVEKGVLEAEESIKSGATISEALRRHPCFPPLLLRMVVMGETTGNLDRSLDNVSEYYSDIIPRRIKKMLTMFEPALTIFMIVVVGLVAVSIYLPILSLMSAIGKQ